MIETTRTYSELDTNPLRVFDWLASSPPEWRITQQRGTGDLVGTLKGDSTPFGSLQVHRDRSVPAEDGVSRYVVTAEGNLPLMLHGKAAKHLTMLPEHLPAAVDVFIDALHRAVPLLGDADTRHRLTRVDASMTWRHERPDQAARALSQARAHLTAQRSGRRVISAHGVETVTLRRTKQHLIRAYDKTAESIAAARGTGTVPDLGDGVLVRLEVEHTRQTARRHYGDDLTALSRFGADMARKAVETTAEPFSRVLADIPTTTGQVAALIAAGADPARAFALVGPSLALAEGGIPALTTMGVSIGTAYRWRAELRSLTDEPVDPEEVDAEQEVIDEEERRHELLWDADQAVYYDRDDS